MAPPKGHPRWGGRKAGTPNRATTGARLVALSFLERRTAEEIDALWEQTKTESPVKALSMWLQAQEFVLPKLGRTEVTGDGGGPVEFVIRDLSREKPEEL